eukprot:Unigene15272_Nuclearia_a/m.45671 Unigene15272_Nuclearia_a/g.45671  ORF Unigene15272_Nuclearia_a/g.45671 Unigene15272_Nuclearia_a/m.45671 type:complete len:160 (+) Unigene15272_Nuclearia_a:3-482(+)
MSSSVIYRGALARTILRLKRVSLTSSALAVAASPFLTAVGDTAVPLAGRIAITSTVAIFGLGSTGLLSFLFRPYVSELRVNRAVEAKGHGDDAAVKVTATTYNFWTRPVQTTFTLDDVQPPGARPFVSFTARGQPFYVHEELITDEALRMRIAEQRLRS